MSFDIWNFIKPYNISINHLRKDEVLTKLFELLFEFKRELPKRLKLSISYYLGNCYYKNYDTRVSFMLEDNIDNIKFSLFNLTLTHGNVYPLEIAFDGENIECKNIKELKEEISNLFNKEFKLKIIKFADNEPEYLEKNNKNNRGISTFSILHTDILTTFYQKNNKLTNELVDNFYDIQHIGVEYKYPITFKSNIRNTNVLSNLINNVENDVNLLELTVIQYLDNTLVRRVHILSKELKIETDN